LKVIDWKQVEHWKVVVAGAGLGVDLFLLPSSFELPSSFDLSSFFAIAYQLSCIYLGRLRSASGVVDP
jgi:hypothetical protein